MASSMPRLIKLQHPALGGDHVEVVRQARLLSLPLTCWRAYIEALPVLYSLNTFTIRSCEEVHLLAAGVGPGTHLIRRLELRWEKSHPPILLQIQVPTESWFSRFSPSQYFTLYQWFSRTTATEIAERAQRKADFRCKNWASTWEAMGKLEGLQWLRVELNVYNSSHQQEWQEHETEALMPLRGVLKDGTDGELKLTWDRTVAKDKSAEAMLKEWKIERRVRY